MPIVYAALSGAAAGYVGGFISREVEWRLFARAAAKASRGAK